MFTQIGMAVKQLFVMITVLFSAGESFARAVEHVAKTTEFTAGNFEDDARVRRAKALAISEAELAVVIKSPLKAASVAAAA